jgi:hypothetical protein
MMLIFNLFNVERVFIKSFLLVDNHIWKIKYRQLKDKFPFYEALNFNICKPSIL